MIFGALGAQQYVGLRQLSYESYCGRFAGISRAQLCFVVRLQRTRLGKLLISLLSSSNSQAHNGGVEGSSPSLSTNDLRALSITRRRVGVGVSRDPKILFVASINRPISAAL
jgi:hypothetical protein